MGSDGGVDASLVDSGAADSGVVDADGDGYASDVDCNDSEANMNPGETEVCDSLDNDCDGTVDNGLSVQMWPDVDGDGYGDPGGTSIQACPGEDGYADNDDDCDDAEGDAFPSNPEVCDGVDNNCSGGVDEGLLIDVHVDADSDGFGDDSMSTSPACAVLPGYAIMGGDCNDASSSINPDIAEVCDGVDNDCAGGVDDGVPLTTFYFDGDGDGIGDGSNSMSACSSPGAGWVLDSGDCDDTNANVSPLRPEICDVGGVDNDCNPATPEPGLQTFYRDGDSDGYGNPTMSMTACVLPAGYVSNNMDCNDANAGVSPLAIELCDGADNNCINGVDEGPVANYPDADDDDFGDDSAPPTYFCEVKPGYSALNTDCNDASMAVNPDATEIPGNGIDEDCNGSDTAGGRLCGLDTTFGASVPYSYLGGALSTGDPSTGGFRGTGFHWDDVEISSNGSTPLTFLYARNDPQDTLEPYLRVHENSCTTSSFTAGASGNYHPTETFRMSRYYESSPAAGYYYAQLSTRLAAQTGDYAFDVYPGNVGGSCGMDTIAAYPLGWRMEDTTLTTETYGAGNPVGAGRAGDDVEFWLQAGQRYTLALEDTGSSSRIDLVRVANCATPIVSATTGLLSSEPLIHFTPTTAGIYAAYISVPSTATSEYAFNVFPGTLGRECFDSAASGDNHASFYRTGLVSTQVESLVISDRHGDFGASRLFDDVEVFLEDGQTLTVTMNSTAFAPDVRLTRAGACTSVIANDTGTTSARTLTYAATAAGIYTVILTSASTNETGSYSYSLRVD